MDHLFFKCDYAQAIWRGARLPNLELIDPNASFETKFQTVLDSNFNTNLSFSATITNMDTLENMEEPQRTGILT